MTQQTAEARPDRAGPTPIGEIHVVDPSPLNWLFITWNTMEEPIRIDEDGRVGFALATAARWPDDTTLEMDVRQGVRFQDGQPFTAHSIKEGFDEMQRWAAPHPPGTWLNFPPESVCEVLDDYTVRFRFPAADGLAVGKFRGFHVPSSAFWRDPGFGYGKEGSGEGHW